MSGGKTLRFGLVLIGAFAIGCGGGGGEGNGGSEVIYFSARKDTTTGYQLWKTDGTADGTVQVKSLAKGGGDPYDFARMGNVSYFFARDGYTVNLWKTDGTAAGTKVVADVNAASDITPIGLTVVKGALYFISLNPTPYAVNDVAIWKSDGTPTGTGVALVPAGERIYEFGAPVEFKDSLYFYRLFSVDQFKLWRTDGTEAGTVEVAADVPDLLTPAPLEVVGGALYFTTNNGQKLWRNDGTSTGNQMVFDAGLGGSVSVVGELNHVTYLCANEVLWKALDAGSIGNVGARCGPGAIEFNGALYFLAADSASGTRQLWKTDGTVPGTLQVTTDTTVDMRYIFGVLNGKLYLSANDALHGTELWTTDGSATHTVLVKDMCSGTCSGLPF